MSWADLRRLAGDRWSPGHHAPFDPIATAHCAARGITLVVTGGDLANLRRVIDGKAVLRHHRRPGLGSLGAGQN